MPWTVRLLVAIGLGVPRLVGWWGAVPWLSLSERAVILLFMRLLAAAGLLVLVIVEQARAAESGTVRATINADGSGTMIVNSQTNRPGETWSWVACTADLSSCAAFGVGRIITTLGATPGTVFRATSSMGAVALSPLWKGNVMARRLPTVRGTVRANRLVTPFPGIWGGGWNGDVHLTQLAACSARSGVGCVALTDARYRGCANGAAVLDRAFTGEFLRVADQDLGPNPVFPAVALSSPYGARVWAGGPAISVAIGGRIAPATGPRSLACGPRPRPPALTRVRLAARLRTQVSPHGLRGSTPADDPRIL